MFRRVSLGVLALAACGGDPKGAPPAEAPIVRPRIVDLVSLAAATHAVPAPLANDPTLAVSALGSVTLLGGAGGLFELGATASLDARAVRALVAVEGVGHVVANAEGLFVFDGTLRPSPLGASLGAAKLGALAARGAELWIGTDLGLYVLKDGQLSMFDASMDVAGLSTFAGSSDVVVHLAGGGHQLYREEAGVWRLQALDDELALDAVVPSAGGRVFAISEGRLFERLAVAGQATWRAVALDAEGPGATGVEALATDPSTGATWVATASSLHRIAGDRIAVVARPSLGRAAVLRVSADGGLWLGDGRSLARVGSEGPPVGYQSHIAPMSAASCDSCHKALGTAPMALTSHAAWVQYVDRAITRMDARTMPPMGSTLTGGTVELVRRWRDDGLRE